MLRIRLARVGAKKKPTYRLVVTDQRKARNSDCVEVVGHYDPSLKAKGVEIRHDRIEYWTGVGAQPSDTVKRLLVRYPKQAAEPAEQPA